MNSTLAQENAGPVGPPWQRAVRWRFLPALLIVLAALAYYGSYLRYWFNVHDEGGTVCLVAQRLMAGERPWIDVEPGYNLGWFYPVIGIFHLTGVHYLAARAWFFVLATITALLGFSIVTRLTGTRWFGLAVGLLLVALPGSQFKNYIPLAAAANTACLLHFLFVDFAARGKWVGAVGLGGVVLGLTYLVRVELGVFFTVIWLGLLLLLLLDRRLAVRQRLTCLTLATVALAGGVVVAQTPAYLHLRAQGLETHYWREYTDWFQFLRISLTDELEKARPRSAPAPPKTLPIATGATVDPAALAPPLPVEKKDGSTLARRPFAHIWTASGRDRLLPFCTYAPLAGFAIFLLAGLAGFLRVLWRREFTIAARPLQVLLLVGGSLTTFPQFFFFRPDRPHLSEFMPGFIIAMSACAWLLWPRGAIRSRWALAAAGVLALFLAAHFTLFGAFAMQHPSAGTIAARKGRTVWFTAENGVRLRVTKREAATLTGVRDAVRAHSGPDDFLICYPYMPGYNVMTNRRTYLRNVYVDNATRSRGWSEKTIEDFQEKRPAVVIVDDRAINGHAPSRFSRWAAPAHAWLAANYTRVGHFGTVEVFARPPVAVSPP